MRQKVHTSLDKDLYKEIKVIAVSLGVNACDLLEIGMKKVLDQYKRGELNECNSRITKE